MVQGTKRKTDLFQLVVRVLRAQEDVSHPSESDQEEFIERVMKSVQQDLSLGDDMVEKTSANSILGVRNIPGRPTDELAVKVMRQVHHQAGAREGDEDFISRVTSSIALEGKRAVQAREALPIEVLRAVNNERMTLEGDPIFVNRVMSSVSRDAQAREEEWDISSAFNYLAIRVGSSMAVAASTLFFYVSSLESTLVGADYPLDPLRMILL